MLTIGHFFFLGGWRNVISNDVFQARYDDYHRYSFLAFGTKFHAQSVMLNCSVRRNVEGLKESLEKVVVPIFCTAKMGAEEGAQTEKLDKVRFCPRLAQHPRQRPSFKV